MNDYEINEIRLIRRQISAEHGHDLKDLAKYYRKIEQELRSSGKYRFLDENITGSEHQRTLPPNESLNRTSLRSAG